VKPFSKHCSELHGVNSDGLCSQFGSRLLKQLSKAILGRTPRD